MNELNDKEIAEIKARADAATAGPWAEHWGDGFAPDITARAGELAAKKYSMTTEVICVLERFVPRFCGSDFHESRSNAEFIAHSRTDIPRLLDTLTAARAEADALKWFIMNYRNVDTSFNAGDLGFDFNFDFNDLWPRIVEAFKKQEGK